MLVNSSDEKPGVSAIQEEQTLINSVCLVVCFPLFKAREISSVFKFKLLSSLFNKVLLPAPLCPVNTFILSLIKFFNLFISVLSITS